MAKPYRVTLERYVPQSGFLDVSADNMREAVLLALNLAKYPPHPLNAPTWTDTGEAAHVIAMDVEAK